MKLIYATLLAIGIAMLAPAESGADILALYDFETSFTDGNGIQKSESIFNRPNDNNAISASVYNSRSTTMHNGANIGGIATTTIDPHAFVRSFTTENSTEGALNSSYQDFEITVNQGVWSMDSLHFEYWVNGVSPGEEYRATIYSDLVGFGAGQELSTAIYQASTNQIPDIQTVSVGGAQFRQQHQQLNENTTVQFRIVFSDNVSSGEIVHRIDDVVVRGFQVESVPEPAAASILMLAGSMILVRRRRNQ